MTFKLLFAIQKAMPAIYPQATLSEDKTGLLAVTVCSVENVTDDDTCSTSAMALSSERHSRDSNKLCRARSTTFHLSIIYCFLAIYGVALPAMFVFMRTELTRGMIPLVRQECRTVVEHLREDDSSVSSSSSVEGRVTMLKHSRYDEVESDARVKRSSPTRGGNMFVDIAEERNEFSDEEDTVIPVTFNSGTSIPGDVEYADSYDDESQYMRDPDEPKTRTKRNDQQVTLRARDQSNSSGSQSKRNSEATGATGRKRTNDIQSQTSTPVAETPSSGVQRTSHRPKSSKSKTSK